ncbi:hypothetical protein GCM10014713_37770 [Streptomyces purpureus]|uniref:Uncharacterized protein n=1 Tax=Streptomyces purpureus TaxID=1951 RepID=A0A918LRL7_9ACTN|nr:hypothetical protein GCM10014713_37770 [Streptomyces purpureus]
MAQEAVSDEGAEDRSLTAPAPSVRGVKPDPRALRNFPSHREHPTICYNCFVNLSLSASECRLLRHLALADMPYSDQDATPAAVRGLDGEQIQDDVRSLKWRGMVAAEGGSLSLTPLGAAAHYAAQVELLSARLVDMSVLADRTRRGSSWG